MSLSKFTVFAVFVSFLAFTIQIVDQLLHGSVFPEGNTGLSWIAFQSWAMYFLAGGTLKGGKEVIVGYLGGCTAAVLIMELAGSLSALGSFFQTPAAIFVMVIPLVLMMRIGWNALVPAIFVSSGVYFAFAGYLLPATGANLSYIQMGITEMIYGALGLTYGWITVSFLNWWTKCNEKPEEKEEEVEAVLERKEEDVLS